ncbi:MAG: DUF4097 family beta strand repeat protein [Verrucomicrobia bacterium]|nr:DUF4097 family beta strand repeat protein [Verrucomicrobiota bacterium]
MRPNLLRHLGAGILSAACLFAALPARSADHESNLEKSFSVSPGGKLIVRADRGSIAVSPAGADKASVQIFRTVKGGTKAKADEAFGNHEVSLQQDGNTITVTARNTKDATSLFRLNQPNLQVRYQIVVPKQFDVDLKTAGGDIALGDLDGQAATRTSSGAIRLQKITGQVEAANAGGDIELAEAGANAIARTSSGSIHVRAAKGRVEAKNAGGNITVDDAGADVIASTSSGSISLKTAKGSVQVRNAGGDIHLGEAGGDASLSTSSGSIRVGKVQRGLEVKNAGGDIQINEGAGSVSASTSSGTIKVQRAAGKLTAKNAGGDVIIGAAGGDVAVSTSSGSIQLGAVHGKVEAKNSGGDIGVEEAGGELVVETSSGSIVIGKANGPVTARNSGGDIRVAEVRGNIHARTSSGTITSVLAAQLQGDCRLEVLGGDIKLSLADTVAVNLNAQSRGGRVTSELPVTTTVQGEPKAGALQGKINGGGPALVLHAGSGNVQLKKH